MPIPPGKKRPVVKGWESLRLTPDQLPGYFDGRPQNIGLLLGAPSGGLVDVDLDAPESVAAGRHLLPDTLRSGRESRPVSHCWYLCDPLLPTRRFGMPGRGDDRCVVELRGTGAQTLVYPSTHPDGDRYVWDEGEIARISGGELSERVEDVAVAALLARNWPGRGGRHDYVLAATGYLGRRMTPERVRRIMGAAINASQDEEATGRLRDVRDTLEAMAAGRPATGGPRLEELAPGVPGQLARWMGWGAEERATADAQPIKGPTQAEKLLQYASAAELSHTPDDTAYATVPVGDHRETHPVRGQRFKQWLLQQYYTELRKAPSAQALADARATLEARALFEGTERSVHLRVAGQEGAVYLDLCNQEWDVIEITAAGWRVLPGREAPVRFVRKDNTAPLPYPARGGGFEDLSSVLNVRSDKDSILLTAWMVGALNPDGPYPVLDLEGEAGTAKSTTARVVRSLVDPAVEPLRAPPRDARDLAIAASGNWTPAFDNLSGIRPWQSDALCRLATGGGFATRELYSDDREVLFSQKRPVILTGIESLATAGDLRDRSIVIELPHIPPEERRPEREFYRAVEEARPKVLGALLDAVSAALRNLHTVSLAELPRMGDFAEWVSAAEEALPWEPGAFVEAYAGNRRDAQEIALDVDPVAVAVRDLIRTREEWTGSASQLLAELGGRVSEDAKHSKAWPSSPQSLSNRLKRLAPALRAAGIEYGEERTGHSGTRTKTIKKTKPAKGRQRRRQDGRPASARRKSADDTSAGAGANGPRAGAHT